MADSDGIICTADEQLLAQSSNGTIVCLTRGQSIGLAFIAEAGFISMIAVVAIFTLIFRKVCLGKKLTERPADVYVLSLFASELLQALGAVMNVKWVNEGKVYTGGYCTAQGITQQIGEPGVALATLAISLYTFVVVLWGKPTYGFLVAYIAVGISWIFVILSAAISAGIGSSEYYTPTPYWCWIGAAHNAERIGGEYFWLWFTLFVSILVYVLLFFWARGNISVDQSHWWKIGFHRACPRIDPDGWRRRSLNMIAYPLVYTITVIPLSVVRWASGFGKDTRRMPDIATFVAVFIYGLSGVLNVALLLSTRPDLFISNRRGRPRQPSTAVNLQVVVSNSTSFGAKDAELAGSKVEYLGE